jgi:hypothetical protein
MPLRLVTWICSLKHPGNPRSLIIFFFSYSRHVEESASRCQRIKTSLPLYFPRFNEHSSDRDEIMFTMAFFASFLVTFSLASPLGRQKSLCPWNGITNADNFTLLAVFKTDNGIREPLALGSNGLPDPSSLAWLGVFMLLILRNDGADMPFMMM